MIGKDEIRQALFAADEIEYSSPQDDFCLQLMLETAVYFLKKDSNRVLFLDGRPFSRCYQIDNVVNAAASLHQRWRILECVCSEDVVRQRLEQQAASGAHSAGNRNFQLYLEVRSRFEAITLPKAVVDTGNPLPACIEHAFAALR